MNPFLGGQFEWCYNKLPKVCGEIEAFSFWENWDPAGTNNSTYIELDLFIQSAEFDIIIEAKVNDKQQKAEQKEDQIQSYLNEYGPRARRLFYIMMGGLWDLDDEKHGRLHYCSLLIF
ncbi:hypothetical protein LQ567_16690 [Niabella pedocola]|uniref:Uncharacterized protein n=1 Tax=Niabella pedocola TaxID=1752077 RepID=A0ABS8PU66_9BACT|nr:hypothetical protein [Niabella pedocola]MCD2424420.1 hypothetical protein [Niabella pedocola]